MISLKSFINFELLLNHNCVKCFHPRHQASVIHVASPILKMYLKVHQNYLTIMWILHYLFSACSRNMRYLRGYQKFQVLLIPTLVYHKSFIIVRQTSEKDDIIWKKTGCKIHLKCFIFTCCLLSFSYAVQIYFVPFPLQPLEQKFLKENVNRDILYHKLLETGGLKKIQVVRVDNWALGSPQLVCKATVTAKI